MRFSHAPVGFLRTSAVCYRRISSAGWWCWSGGGWQTQQTVRRRRKTSRRKNSGCAALELERNRKEKEKKKRKSPTGNSRSTSATWEEEEKRKREEEEKTNHFFFWEDLKKERITPPERSKYWLRTGGMDQTGSCVICVLVKVFWGKRLRGGFTFQNDGISYKFKKTWIQSECSFAMKLRLFLLFSLFFKTTFESVGCEDPKKKTLAQAASGCD